MGGGGKGERKKEKKRKKRGCGGGTVWRVECVMLECLIGGGGRGGVVMILMRIAISTYLPSLTKVVKKEKVKKEKD